MAWGCRSASFSPPAIGGDGPQAEPLIEGLPAEVFMAEAAYDADRLRQAVADKGAVAVIPNKPVPLAEAPGRQFRRAATRFEKTARNYLAVVTLAAIVLGLR